MTSYIALPASLGSSLTKSEEYSLITRSKEGDHRAQNRLAQSMYPKLEKHIRFNPWISALAPIEDLIQEGMKGIREAFEKFDFSTGNRFWTFFRWKAKGHIMDYLKYLYRKHGKTDWDLSLDWIGNDEETVQITDESDVFAAVEFSLMTERHHQAIREALAPLPWIERKIIALKFACGWSYSQISKQLDIPLSTASWRVRNAIDALRERLSQILERPITLEEIGWEPEAAPEPLPLPPESAIVVIPEEQPAAQLPEPEQSPAPTQAPAQPQIVSWVHRVVSRCGHLRQLAALLKPLSTIFKGERCCSPQGRSSPLLRRQLHQLRTESGEDGLNCSVGSASPSLSLKKAHFFGLGVDMILRCCITRAPPGSSIAQDNGHDTS